MQPGEDGTQPRDPNQRPSEPDPTAPGTGEPVAGESATQQYSVPPHDGGTQQYPSVPGYPQGPPSDAGTYWAQPGYGQPPYPPHQHGQHLYAQPQYGAPAYGQPPYGQPAYGPGYGPGGYGAPPPPAKNNTTKILIAAGAALLVIIAAVIVLLATHKHDTNQTAGSGGNSTTTSASAPTSPSGESTSPSGQSTTTGASSSGVNPAGSSCEPGKKADLAAIDLMVVLGFIQPGSEPTGYFRNVINACAAPDLVPQLKSLYGEQFGIPEGDDKTGGNGTGPTAEYTFKDRDGHTLDLTMTKSSDGHYQATKFTYDG